MLILYILVKYSQTMYPVLLFLHQIFDLAGQYPQVETTAILNFLWLCLGHGSTWLRVGKNLGLGLIQKKVCSDLNMFIQIQPKPQSFTNFNQSPLVALN